MAAEPAVSGRALTKHYRTDAGEVHALRGVDIDIEPGVLTVIAGPSGSGKSSLLRLLACQDRPTTGTVRLGGTDVSTSPERDRRRVRRRHVGYVFQRPSDNLLSYLDAREHIELGARLRGSAPDLGVLSALGLDGRASHRPDQLSGGEQQRLAFAAAVAGDPTIVAADEPTAELDNASGRLLIDAVLGLRARGIALVIASHETMMISAADRVVRLADGSVDS